MKNTNKESFIGYFEETFKHMSIGFTYNDTEVKTTGESIKYIDGTPDFKHEYRNGAALRNPKSKKANLYLRINRKHENLYNSFYYKNR